MKCGVIYLKIVPKSKNTEWIKYCHLVFMLPDLLQERIKNIMSEINSKYIEQIIVPLYFDIHPGCIVEPDYVSIIAENLYNSYNEMILKTLKEECVRCVYSVGEVTNPNSEVNIHQAHGEVLIKVGRFLDSSDKSGLYKI